jgi:hypothetical protein
MTSEKFTPDQSAADKIGRAIEGQIFRLNEERTTLLAAATRIIEIDAELVILLAEQQRIASRRPPKPVSPIDTRPAAQQASKQ